VEIIPSIYIKNGKAVKLAEGWPAFDEDPLRLARLLEAAGASYIYVFDLDVPPVGHIPHIPILEGISSKTSLKILLGGGIKTTDTISRYIKAGVEMIILGSIAYQKPQFLSEACTTFPNRIATRIDIRRGRVFIPGFTVAAHKGALEYAKQFKEAGVTAIVCSSVTEDGKTTEEDIKIASDMIQSSPLQVIYLPEIGSAYEMDRILSLAHHNLKGIIIEKAMYNGTVDISATITHAMEITPAGSDEPTLIP